MEATVNKKIDLIYCAGGNKRFAEIAIDHGFLYGAQLPATVYFSPHFADQDWKNPNKEKYIDALERHKPSLASVLDFEYIDQFEEVMEWAEEAAAHVDTVMIIPKCFGCIGKIPRKIGGADVRLGYSVPTRHGGTAVPAWEFNGWPVHLLGGSPHAQMRLAPYFNTISADGNYVQKVAIRYCQFWTNGNAQYAHNRYFPKLEEADGRKWGDGSKEADAPYEAFRRSCVNIMNAWQGTT